MSGGADLTLEFLEGFHSAAAGYSELNCPHYATSDAADAWHTGDAWQRAGKSANNVSRASRGRGNRINVYLPRSVVVARVCWNDPSLSDAPPVRFEPYQPGADRAAMLLELGANAPLQSKGKPVKDAGELPLFIAGNEPTLF